LPLPLVLSSLGALRIGPRRCLLGDLREGLGLKHITGSQTPRRTFMAAAVAMLAGVAFADVAAGQALPAGAAEPPPQGLEPIGGVTAGPRGLMVRVTSHGCTTKADFAHYTEPRGEAVTVAFARRRLDRCGGAARELDLVFSHEELGLVKGQPVVVLNPIGR
jgi:hypothetical protein